MSDENSPLYHGYERHLSILYIVDADMIKILLAKMPTLGVLLLVQQ